MSFIEQSRCEAHSCRTVLLPEFWWCTGKIPGWGWPCYCHRTRNKVTGVSHIYQKLTKVRCTLLLHPYFSLILISYKVISDNIIYSCNYVTVTETLLWNTGHQSTYKTNFTCTGIYTQQTVHVLCINSSAC